MGTEDLSLSIVICNYNGQFYLKSCLTSLLESRFITDYEILVIDNHSNDNSLKIIEEFQKSDEHIKVLKNRKNVGVPFSRNKAIQSAKGDILIFLDNDTNVDRKWIEGMIETFMSDPTVGAAQCKIFDFKKRDTIQEVGMKIIPFTGFGSTIGRGEKDHGQYDRPLEIVALGAALAVRKDVAIKIGGFDRELYYCTDDLDFSWRVWLSGYRVVLSPKAKVYHYTKEHKIGYKLYYHLSKNSLRMIIKNYETPNIIRFLPTGILINILGVASVLLKRRNFSAAWGIIMGLCWNLFFLPSTLAERQRVQSLRVTKDRDLFVRIMAQGQPFSRS